MISQSSIDGFLSRKRIAFLGLSRDPKHFSRLLYEEFRKRNFEIAPVNPNTDSLDGIECFKSVTDLPPSFDAAMLMVPKAQTAAALRACAEHGIKSAWVYGVMGEKELTPEYISAAKETGMELIGGLCPLMFFKDAGFLHRFHAWIWRMIGKIPG